MPDNKFEYKGKQYLAVPEIGHQCGVCTFITNVVGCKGLQRHLGVANCKDHDYIAIRDTPEGTAAYVRYKMGVDIEEDG